MQPPASEGQPVRGRVKRLGRMARGITTLATLILLVGWGVFATTTIVPNPSDQASVYGAYQSTSPVQWPPDSTPDHYNLPVGSTIDYVFDITYSLNYGSGCGGYTSINATNGTWVSSCSLPKPGSTPFMSSIGYYLTFNIRNDPKCCQQTYFSWLSGPSGNLTQGQSAGGFFAINQAGNYSFHISNTNLLPPPAFPAGYVNGTLTFSYSYVLFTHPYFLAGIATLVVAIAVAGFSVFSLSKRRSRRPAGYRERPLPKEMSD